MMIKYRVHEVAKDLNVPSKEVVDLLKKYFGDTIPFTIVCLVFCYNNFLVYNSQADF